MPALARPTPNPFGVVYRGVLSRSQCHALSECVTEEGGGYHFPGCLATTRDYDYAYDWHLAALTPLADLAVETNAEWWNYDLDDAPGAWLQSYGPGGKYPTHMDASPGQSRKLTAVAMLSDPDEYDGGELTIITAGARNRRYAIPREQGTVVVFQPWLLHMVSEVTRGYRQTVNLGFWGPPLR